MTEMNGITEPTTCDKMLETIRLDKRERGLRILGILNRERRVRVAEYVTAASNAAAHAAEVQARKALQDRGDVDPFDWTLSGVAAAGTGAMSIAKARMEDIEGLIDYATEVFLVGVAA